MAFIKLKNTSEKLKAYLLQSSPMKKKVFLIFFTKIRIQKTDETKTKIRICIVCPTALDDASE
jgi:hypothetical protein